MTEKLGLTYLYIVLLTIEKMSLLLQTSPLLDSSRVCIKTIFYHEIRFETHVQYTTNP